MLQGAYCIAEKTELLKAGLRTAADGGRCIFD